MSSKRKKVDWGLVRLVVDWQGLAFVVVLTALALGIGMSLVWLIQWVGMTTEPKGEVEVPTVSSPPEAGATEEVPQITVPVDIYDRSLGKVVVEVTVYGEELTVSSTVLDGGAPDPLMLCVVGGTAVGLAGSGGVVEIPSPSAEHVACAAQNGSLAGMPLTMRIVNTTGVEQKMLVVAGLARTHNVLQNPGRVADNPSWDCDVRPGTIGEGMEGSTVGLWPRPVQDCSGPVLRRPSLITTPSTWLSSHEPRELF